MGGCRRRTVFNHCCLLMYYGYILLLLSNISEAVEQGQVHDIGVHLIRGVQCTDQQGIWQQSVRENIVCSCLARGSGLFLFFVFFCFQLSNKISSNKSNQSWKIEDIIISWSREKLLEINSARVLGQKRRNTLLLALLKAVTWFCFNYLSSSSRVHEEKAACVRFLVSPAEGKTRFDHLSKLI